MHRRVWRTVGGALAQAYPAPSFATPVSVAALFGSSSSPGVQQGEEEAEAGTTWPPPNATAVELLQHVIRAWVGGRLAAGLCMPVHACAGQVKV